MRKSLTITEIDGKLYYFQMNSSFLSTRVVLFESADTKKFSKSDKKFSLAKQKDTSVSLAKLTSLQISHENNAYIAVMGFGDAFYIGQSKDGFSWNIGDRIKKPVHGASIVSSYLYQDQHVLYWSDDSLHIGFSKDMVMWTLYDDPIFEPRLQSNQTLHLLHTFVGVEEMFVSYVIDTDISGKHYFSLSVAIFSKSDPRKIAWRFQYPVWSVPEKYIETIISPINTLSYRKKIYSFWQTNEEKGVLSIVHALLEQIIFDERKGMPYAAMGKVKHNPILSPRAEHSWESRAVFNPAALYDEEEKKVHLLYRAVGDSWTSVLGYAGSSDGIHIDRTDDLPAYFPRLPFEGANVRPDPNSPFSSGPGVGGCEDPRLTKVENKVYLTYVAYNGWSGPRAALSSIEYDDFKNQNWNWSDPVLISKPGVVDKNACIFPEKVNGKYVILHRVFPHILVDFVDSLDFDGKTFLKGEYYITPSASGWDSRKVGAGPPPIKTPYGWLLIYHAVDDRRDHEYQIGAMLLDLNDPTKVLYRSTQPIIRPTHWYENQGYKSGVVYPCGAVVKDNTLHVYYGGADTYVCAATAPLPEFLDSLMHQNPTIMQRLQFIHD